MQSKKLWSGLGLIFLWTILNFLGLVVGLIPALWASFSMPYSGTPFENIYQPGVLAGLLGVVLGSFQWLALKTKIAHISLWMILVTGIGFTIGVIIAAGGYYFISANNLEPAYPQTLAIILSILIGASLGTAQWFILRRHIIDRSSLWIIGSAIGMGLAFSLPWGSQSYAPTDALQATIPLIFIALRAVIVYCVITGILLAWLLRNNPG